MYVKYDPRNDPETWYVKPSPDESKPAWTSSTKRPLITYTSTATIIKINNIRPILSELIHPNSGRSFVQQGVCI